ncbi:MAG: HAD family phosphatase [Actinobacteria bacterium]|nr:HAD family phosphatase [Actinomycetota bacterium]
MLATDFDRTLVWEDGRLHERTIAALQRAQAAGLHVIVVTGRMFQSTRLALRPAGLHEPVICYQGAVVADGDGTWLRHVPIELELAHEAIAFVAEAGYSPNVYVDDELYVSEVTQHARDYAGFQHLEIHPVGDLLAWLSSPPTKLVCVGDPDELSAVEERAKAHFGERLYISKSLPYFLEFAAPGVTKGAGLDFLAAHMGFTPEETISFGDGENDVELVEWAGYGVAVENAHERVKAVADWIGPSAEQEGVAQVIEAYLDSLT